MPRTALITGGTHGIGLQIVRDLLKENYVVISISRNKERADKAAKNLGLPYDVTLLHETNSQSNTNTNTKNNILFLIGDVTKTDDINAMFDVIDSRFGRLDVLINNAGIISAGGIEELDTTDWEDMIEVNLNAPYKITKKMLPLLKRTSTPNTSILNISSISSRITGSSIGYSTCKAGMDMMTKSLAKELAPYGIRVNSVNPGLVDTEFQVTNHVISEEDYENFLEQAAKPYPLGVGTPEDVSNLVMFLISEKAKWITGANYVIDGGRLVNT